MDESTKKTSFFKKVKWAIFNPENYEIFAVENLKSGFKYFIIILLLFSLLTAIGITYRFTITDFRNIPELEENVTNETIEAIENMPKAELYAMLYVIAVIYIFIAYFVIILVDVLLLSLLGYITSKVSKTFLKYSAIVNISIYALTLPIILNATYIIVRCFTEFEIKYFQIMYNAIAYIYVVTAILMIRSEMIKQAAELAKIEEEQKKVREELERQEEEEKQKEEQKKKEREEEKKKKEKERENKEKGNNDSPEGSMAIKVNDKCNDSN